MRWEELSMSERAKYIQLGVQNGINSLSSIRESYNRYAEGGGVEIRGTSGNVLGTFSNKREAQNYINNNKLEQVFQEPELDEIVVYGNRPKKQRSVLDMANSNFTETFGVSPRDAAGFVPYLGDALDIRDIKNNIANSEYKEAALGIAGLLLPNFIEKPIKAIGTGLRKGLVEAIAYTEDAFNPKRTIKAIREKRYTPFMSKEAQKAHNEKVKRNIESFVLPRVQRISDADLSIRKTIGQYHDQELDFFSPSPIWEKSKAYPTIKIPFALHALGNYNGHSNIIKVLSTQHGHSLASLTDMYDEAYRTAAHEYGHFFTSIHPDVDKITRPRGGYFEPNPKSYYYSLFKPLEKHKVGNWKRSPDEVIADMYEQRYLYDVLNFRDLSEDSKRKVTKYIKRRHGLKKRQVETMLEVMSEFGLKNGGFLK